MAAKTAKKTPNEQPCPKCGGHGLIVQSDGQVAKCDCGVWDREQFRLAIQRARIPRRYLNKSLKEFKAAPRDARRKVLKDGAASYAMAFSHEEDRGLLLRGTTGSGKTHLAVGILIEILNRGYNGLYCNVTDLLARLRDSYSNPSADRESQILEEMENTDLLVLDDLGAEATTDWVRDRIYLIVNRRYESAKPTIVTTNCDDAELRERIGPRTTSRLYEMCQPLGEFPQEDFRFLHMR